MKQTLSFEKKINQGNKFILSWKKWNF